MPYEGNFNWYWQLLELWISRRRRATFLVFREFFHCAEEIIGLGEDGIFEYGLVSHEGVDGGDAAHRRIEMVEKLIGNAGGDFRAVTPA